MKYCIITRSKNVNAGKANSYFLTKFKNDTPQSMEIIRYEDSEMGNWNNLLEKLHCKTYDGIFIANDSDILVKDIDYHRVVLGIDNFSDDVRCVPLEYISY